MPKNVVITGANRGIGLALTKQYVAAGNTVFAVCRNSSEELDSLQGVTIVDGVDVVKEEHLGRLLECLGDNNVDILINNAGILTEETLGEIDFDLVERQFQVNAMAPLKVTETLLNKLDQGSKVALISSRMGSIGDNKSGGAYGYRMSKAALNAAGVSLAYDLKPKGVALVLLHPGFVKTSLVGHQGDIDTIEAAEHIRNRIDEINLDNTGLFRHSNGETLPW